MDTSILNIKKVHPAIEYFKNLQDVAASENLAAFLADFAKPKSIDTTTFTIGVKKFIALANSNPLDQQYGRKALYKNIYAGLHYSNNLVNLWNAENISSEQITKSQITTLAPSSWDYTIQDGFLTLIYKGTQPAEALDELVKGPSIIDCGMFTQLSLWFGLRYILGNERFNHCFGRTPLFITQFLYHAIEDNNQPYHGNPLYTFLSNPTEITTAAVNIKYIQNTPLYRVKHPGGTANGENCIVIGEQYYMFNNSLTDSMTVTDILHWLRQEFNLSRQ